MKVDWIEVARRSHKRFWSKVTKLGRKKCWLWIGHKDKDGYGRFIVTAGPGVHRHFRSHRLALMIHLNVDPKPSLVTIHSCDVAACVNPLHLRFGSQSENRADCGRKGRNASGDRSGHRLHPERWPSGKDHWTHKNPDLVPRGDRWFVGKRKNINRRK